MKSEEKFISHQVDQPRCMTRFGTPTLLVLTETPHIILIVTGERLEFIHHLQLKILIDYDK